MEKDFKILREIEDGKFREEELEDTGIPLSQIGTHTILRIDVVGASDSPVKTATVPGFELGNFQFFIARFVNGNIANQPTLSINGSYPFPIQLNSTNVTTTIFSLITNAHVPMYFDGLRFHIAGSMRGQDDNTDTIDVNRYSYNLVAGVQVTRYKLLLEGIDGKMYPVTIGDSLGTTKTVSTQAFRLNGLILYNQATTSTAANAVSTIWRTATPASTVAYTFNSNLTGTQLPIYLVGIMQADGSFKLDNSSFTSWYTQTLPTSADGKIYIYIGHQHSTNSFRLVENHPIYEYKNGRVRLYTPEPEAASLSTLIAGLEAHGFFAEDELIYRHNASGQMRKVSFGHIIQGLYTMFSPLGHTH